MIPGPANIILITLSQVVGELLGYPDSSRHCRRPYPLFSSSEKQAWILETVRSLEPEEAKLQKA